MTDETIVAVYDSAAHAEAAVAALKAEGAPDSAITMHAENVTGTTAATQPDQGFWSRLFGAEPDSTAAVYDRSLKGGATVVTVQSPAGDVTRVVQILESHHPVDMEERAASYGVAQTTTTTTQPLTTPTMPVATAQTAATGNEAIQLSEESLVVGTRVVNRGGTRIRRFVVENPVEQTVTLHEEKVMVERRPVTDGRPVTDTAAFTDKTIEMMETAEEAVVGKTARVVEEVAIRKEAVEHTETIRDTVRKEEVEIEQVPGTSTETTTGVTPMNPRAPKI